MSGARLSIASCKCSFGASTALSIACGNWRGFGTPAPGLGRHESPQLDRTASPLHLTTPRRRQKTVAGRSKLLIDGDSAPPPSNALKSSECFRAKLGARFSQGVGGSRQRQVWSSGIDARRRELLAPDTDR